MATWVDEVETAVHSVVLDVSSVETRLIAEVLVVLVIHIVNDGLPATRRKLTACVQMDEIIHYI